jgi:hypothetical protein
MHKAVLRLFALVALLVAGCGPVYETTYELTPPRSAEGRLCASQCANTQQYCRRNCSLEADQCKSRAREDGRREYYRYVQERREKGKSIDRSESSFENTYSCGDSACKNECGSDFRACHVNCGGTVTPHRVCTAFCEDRAAPSASSAPPSRSSPDQAAPPSQPSSAAASLCRPNARVKVLWEGEWYPAKVKSAMLADGRCPIHYDGYGSEDDEAVTPDRLSK